MPVSMSQYLKYFEIFNHRKNSLVLTVLVLAVLTLLARLPGLSGELLGDRRFWSAEDIPFRNKNIRLWL